MNSLKRKIGKMCVVFALALCAPHVIASNATMVRKLSNLNIKKIKLSSDNGDIILEENEAKKLLREGKRLGESEPADVMIWGTHMGGTDFMALLLNHPFYKAYVNTPHKKFGLAPLAFAAINGRCDIANQLIKNGANIYLRDIQGLTPVMRAAFNGKTNIIELLHKEAMSDKNKNMMEQHRQDMNESLLLAAQGISDKTVSFLLSHGAENVENALKVAETMRIDNFKLSRELYPDFTLKSLRNASDKIHSLLKNKLNETKQGKGCDVSKKVQAARDQLEEALKREEQKEMQRNHKNKMILEKQQQEKEKKSEEKLRKAENAKKSKALRMEQERQAMLERARQKAAQEVQEYEMAKLQAAKTLKEKEEREQMLKRLAYEACQVVNKKKELQDQRFAQYLAQVLPKRSGDITSNCYQITQQ